MFDPLVKHSFRFVYKISHGMTTCVLDLCNNTKECCKCNDLYILQDRSAVKFDPIDESKKEVRLCTSYSLHHTH